MNLASGSAPGWEPRIGENVRDLRWDSTGDWGVVVHCTRFGHFADPYWRASVRWSSGYIEDGISTVWLAREDETPG